MTHPALVAVIALLAYLPTFAGVFQFDDYNVIVNYPAVHSWGALVEDAGGVRPLLKASYALSWTLGLGVFGFHLLNVAVHVLNAMLVYAVGRALCERWLGDQAERFRGAILAAALLFALHPVQVEAVTYVSGRSASLMASFYLGALLAYLRGAHWGVSTLLFVLALATKETALTLPAALLLCELSSRAPSLRRQVPHWIVLAAAVAVLFLHARYFELVSFGFTRRDIADNLLTQIGGISYLALRLVGLHGYNIDPALPVVTEWSAVLAGQAAALAALGALGAASLRSRPWIGFGVLWFFLQLAPTNSIVPRLDVANDRQLYLACWGLFFALSVQIALAWPRARILRPSLALLLMLFAGTSIWRQLDYRSEIALWEADVRKAPWNARAHNNLGYAYQQAGLIEEARREYQAAELLEPGGTKARFNLLLLAK